MRARQAVLLVSGQPEFDVENVEGQRETGNDDDGNVADPDPFTAYIMIFRNVGDARSDALVVVVIAADASLHLVQVLCAASLAHLESPLVDRCIFIEYYTTISYCYTFHSTVVLGQVDSEYNFSPVLLFY